MTHGIPKGYAFLVERFAPALSRTPAAVGAAVADQIVDPDPPEVSYLVIDSPHVDRPMGEKLDLRPIS
jgi:hypothetical protein